ncbi:MAG: hypothetical protein LBF71_00570 [Campylobacteraceae bacterium]|jgi:hypothetical protein|nr:hypothetical protein [Campylobacteraceae bacterium]
MKLQYLQPISNASGWGAGLAALGKGVKDTANWSLERMDKDKEHARADKTLENQTNLTGAQVGNLNANTDATNQNIAFNKELHPYNLQYRQTQNEIADLTKRAQEYKNIALKQDADDIEWINKNIPKDSRSKALVEIAKKSNPSFYEGMSDEYIIALAFKNPEIFESVNKLGTTYFNMGIGYEGENQYGYFGNPYNPTIKKPMGKSYATDKDGNPMIGKGSDGDNFTAFNAENPDGTKQAIIYSKKTGEWIDASSGKEIKNIILDDAVARVLHKKVLGKDPSGIFVDSDTDISRSVGGGKYETNINNFAPYLGMFVEDAFDIAYTPEGVQIVKLNPKYAKNPSAIYKQATPEEMAKAWSNANINSPFSLSRTEGTMPSNNMNFNLNDYK